jgi:FAD/FMN-containing dehydrogenase
VLDGSGPAVLTALEHFDERYVRAINYRNRSARTEIPKAVLLIDVEGNDPSDVNTAIERMVAIVAPYETEAIPARNEQERKLFWKDRKNLGAIARHTNAFKLNEDIVIPLEALPAFADLIERVNLEKEFANSSAVIEAVQKFRGEAPQEDDVTLVVVKLM